MSSIAEGDKPIDGESPVSQTLEGENGGREVLMLFKSEGKPRIVFTTTDAAQEKVFDRVWVGGATFDFYGKAAPDYDDVYINLHQAFTDALNAIYKDNQFSVEEAKIMADAAKKILEAGVDGHFDVAEMGGIYAALARIPGQPPLHVVH